MRALVPALFPATLVLATVKRTERLTAAAPPAPPAAVLASIGERSSATCIAPDTASAPPSVPALLPLKEEVLETCGRGLG